MTPSELQNTVDDAVMRDLAAGKLEALEALYDRLAEPLYALAMRICGDENRAATIVEQVFSDVWARRGGFAVASSFVSELLGRCRELALEGARGNRQAPAQAPTVAANSPVARILERVPPEARAALEIAYFEGLTIDAIAARTGTSRARVLEHLRRSLAELRPLLSGGVQGGTA